MSRDFTTLFIFYISYSWFTRFSVAILPTIFLSSHLSFQQMILGVILGFIGQTLLVVSLKNLNSKTSWRLALISVFIYILLVISIRSPYQFYLASFINGFALFFFFVFYNVAHFTHTPTEKRGHSSALMFIVPSFIGVIGPIVAGFLAQTNIVLLWTVSFLSFLFSLTLISKQTDFRVIYTLGNALEEIKATRIFIFIEGIWEALIFSLIPIYTLYFIKTPLNYGIFVSYLAGVSILANFTLGKVTDKLQKRSVFLFPLTIIISLATIIFAVFQGNLISWIIMTSVIQFLLPLFWNLTMALVVDAHPNLQLAIPGREFVLAIGRIIGCFMVFVSFGIEPHPFYIFIVLGLVMLLFPLKLFWNNKVSKKYKYL